MYLMVGVSAGLIECCGSKRGIAGGGGSSVGGGRKGGCGKGCCGKGINCTGGLAGNGVGYGSRRLFQPSADDETVPTTGLYQPLAVPAFGFVAG